MIQIVFTTNSDNVFSIKNEYIMPLWYYSDNFMLFNTIIGGSDYNIVIMGNNTYKNLNMRKYKDKSLYVLTKKHKQYTSHDDLIYFNNLEDAIMLAMEQSKKYKNCKISIIGGLQLILEALNLDTYKDEYKIFHNISLNPKKYNIDICDYFPLNKITENYELDIKYTEIIKQLFPLSNCNIYIKSKNTIV